MAEISHRTDWAYCMHLTTLTSNKQATRGFIDMQAAPSSLLLQSEMKTMETNLQTCTCNFDNNTLFVMNPRITFLATISTDQAYKLESRPGQITLCMRWFYKTEVILKDNLHDLFVFR